MKSKNFLCCLLVTIIMFVSCCPVISFASKGQEATSVSSPIEIVSKSSLRKNFSIGAATGLITQTKLDMAKAASNKIAVYATTGCIPEISKCGFTEIVVQRRLDTSQPWSNYITYNDLYSSSSYYNSGFTVMVTTGYQYRLTGIHYAYRNIFTTQKMNNYSTYMQF